MLPIAFIDDHTQLRGLISKHLQKDPFNYQVFQYENGLDFINQFPKQNYIPTIVLMDIRMSPMNGYETTEWLHINYPEIPILAFSDVHHIEAIIKISQCGASGCTDKNFRDDEYFKKAIEKVINREKHYDTIEIHKMVNKFLLKDKKEITEGFCSLTPRETEIFKLVAENISTSENAENLFISNSTYKTHISKIHQKLGIHTTAALKQIAYSLGLIINP